MAKIDIYPPVQGEEYEWMCTLAHKLDYILHNLNETNMSESYNIAHSTGRDSNANTV